MIDSQTPRSMILTLIFFILQANGAVMTSVVGRPIAVFVGLGSKELDSRLSLELIYAIVSGDVVERCLAIATSWSSNSSSMFVGFRSGGFSAVSGNSCKIAKKSLLNDKLQIQVHDYKRNPYRYE